MAVIIAKIRERQFSGKTKECNGYERIFEEATTGVCFSYLLLPLKNYHKLSDLK